MRRDVASLQIGTTANYVGTHFWNLQDEYLAVPPGERELSPATFFREVSTESRAARSGLRYAPRLQIIDATGSFGALSTDAGVVLDRHEEGATQPLPSWSHRVERYVRRQVRHSNYVANLLAAERNPSSEHQDFAGGSETADFWSDYQKTRLHPRSCRPLPGVHHNVTNLSTFQGGKDIATTSFVEDAYDDLRFFIEDCDSFGGLVVTTNADDAYAGIASEYMSFLQDELGSSSPVLVFSVHDVNRVCTASAASCFNRNFYHKREALWAQNEAKLVGSCLELSAEYVPLSSCPISQISSIYATVGNLFHSSSILGLAMDVSLMSIQQNLSLAGLLSALRPAPFASVASLASIFPTSMTNLEYGLGMVRTRGVVNFSSIWSTGPAAGHMPKSSISPGIGQSSFNEVVAACGLGYSLPVFSNIVQPVTIPVPYPKIFDSSLERNRSTSGKAIAKEKKQCPSEVEQIAVVAGLATDNNDARSGLASLGESLYPGNRSSRAQSAARSLGVEDDDLRETAELLRSRADDYATL